MENTTLVFNSSTKPEELVKQINKVRLTSKNRWYQITLENETYGKRTRLKIFGTWIQLDESCLFSTEMDNTPTEFKENLLEGVTNLINNY